jgi:puromycin-sensitive aminopeptidase
MEGAGEAIRLRQCRFLYLHDDGAAATTWQVPITYRARVNGKLQHGRLLLSTEDGRVTFPRKPDWVVMNEGGHGFYRVQYAPELLAPLLRAPAEILTPIERFNLINDAWAATLAGILPAVEYLDLTARFKGETDRHVWTPIVASLAYLSRVVPPDARPGLERLVRDRLGEVTARLGWSPEAAESDLVRELRGEVLRTMGMLGNDTAVQREAQERHVRGETERLDPNVLAALIWIVAHTGGEPEYEEFFARFKSAKTPQDEQRYLRALAGFRQPDLVRRTLDLSLNGEVRTQDAPFLVRDLLLGVHSREMAWAFVKDHWEEMARVYPPQSGLRRLCEGVTGLTTSTLAADVQEFFTSRAITFGGKTLEQYLEQLQIGVRFRERASRSLAAYLARP